MQHRPSHAARDPKSSAMQPVRGDGPGNGKRLESGAKSRGHSRKLQASSSVPTAGIGASAGGLEALRRFVSAIPPKSGVGYVIIQHLDPTQVSLTAEILAKHSAIPVVQAQPNVRVEADHVYVIPPNRFMSIDAGVLRLIKPPTPRGARMPIDFFLKSLAIDQAEAAIGIILSGTGTDGTAGLKEIRAAGGICMAQDAESAQYDGMPASAIASGCVDHVLQPEKMPGAIRKFAKHPYTKRNASVVGDGDKLPEHFDEVIALLRTRTRFDFGSYKHGTLARRIHRRMVLRHSGDIKEYVGLLRRDADEVAALKRDLLINVTNFFRDPQAWRYLAEEVIPGIIESKADGAPIRAWVAGCATGEEAYTMAMVLTEAVQASHHKNCAIQIFASDVEDDVLEIARAGIYPETIAADVSQERLHRFFVKGNDTYTVKKELRDTVVFARQNLIADPPFSRLDVVSCRNVLIYLLPEAQRRIVALAHFSLREKGCLMLSAAESVGQQDDLFETVSKKWRIYRRIGTVRHDRVEFHPEFVAAAGRARSLTPAYSRQTSNVVDNVQRMLVDRFAPATVVIDRKYHIVHFSGPIHDYLTFPTGEPTTDLISSAREGLQSKLRAAIHRAIGEGRPVSVEGMRIKRNGHVQAVRATVEPLTQFRGVEGLLLILFASESGDQPGSEAATPPVPAPPESNQTGDSTIPQLEYELKTTREDLQNTIEEMEASNEELKASNEEVMSVNEELQSTNEELETSKEELQSLNEELTTVNGQLQSKVAELETANSDVNNLLANTDIPTVFLDARFRIKRYTPAICNLLHLIPGDVGRPLKDISGKFSGKDLFADAKRVLAHLKPMESELESEDGRLYMLRILPYRTREGHTDGVVITFIDITLRKQSEEKMRLLAAVLKDSNDAVIVHDLDGNISVWNWGAQQMYGYTEQEALEMNMRRLSPPGTLDQSSEFRRVLRGQAATSAETQRITKDGRILDVWMTLTVLTGSEGKPIALATTERDITDQKRAQEQMRLYQRDLRSLAGQTLLAEERERRRLAADLHDGLGQTLNVIRMKLAALCKSPAKVAERKRVTELTQLLDQTIQAASSLTFELSPPVLHELGLLPAARWLAEDIERKYGLKVTVRDLGGVKSVPGMIAVVLFRCLRELMVNVAKHAHAKKGQITFSSEKHILKVTVEDDGRGFDSDIQLDPARGARSRGGFGLFSIRERLQHLEGQMTIRSNGRRGTIVTLTVPLSDKVVDDLPENP